MFGISIRNKRSSTIRFLGSKQWSDPDSSLFDGPSVSGISSAAVGAVGVEKFNTATTTTPPTITISEAGEGNKNLNGNTFDVSNTPSSTASTTPLISVPNSPDTVATPNIIVTTTTNTTESLNSNDTIMPAKTTFTSVATTTTAEIMDENRFSILGKDISDEIDVYDLPSPPKNGHNTPPPEVSTNALLNASNGTAASTATTPSPSITPKQDNDRDSLAGSPTKKKHHHKHENNNHQNDINSIESITDNTKLPSSDLEWIDELLLERNSREMLSKKKKKKKMSTTKELDQLDGVSNKHNTKDEINDDENVVKCLYYTLMCCECTIS